MFFYGYENSFELAVLLRTSCRFPGAPGPPLRTTVMCYSLSTSIPRTLNPELITNRQEFYAEVLCYRALRGQRMPSLKGCTIETQMPAKVRQAPESEKVGQILTNMDGHGVQKGVRSISRVAAAP